MFASLNLTNSSSEAAARARAVTAAQQVVGKLLEAPASDVTVDRIYIGHYHQSEIVVQVEFHLGTKARSCCFQLMLMLMLMLMMMPIYMKHDGVKELCLSCLLHVILWAL